MAQSYSNPASRNTQVAADSGQGQGTIPSKVSVPFPQNANQPTGKTNSSNVPGFSGGLIAGKV